MAKPYSDDLRLRVARAIGEGGTCRAIADRFGLAPSTVVKWSRRLRETGSVEPAKFGGHLKCRLQAHHAFIASQIEETPHLTLHGLKDLLAERGIAVSHDTVWRFLRCAPACKIDPRIEVNWTAPLRVNTIRGAVQSGVKVRRRLTFF